MGVKAIFQKASGEFIDLFTKQYDEKDYIYALANAHAIDLIARTIAKTELQIFALNSKNKIEETHNDLYWRINVQPNFNENAIYFRYKLICQLLLKQKAIIVMIKNRSEKIPYMYVADSYNCNNNILKGKSYKDIMISDYEGNSFSLNKEYKYDEVISFSFYNSEMKNAIEKYKKEISKILDITSKKYKKCSTEKWRLKNPGNQLKIMDMETGKEITRDEYKNKMADGLFEENDSIVMLSEQFGLENLNKDKTFSFSNLGDVEKSICDKVAMSYNIPLDIFYGNRGENSKNSTVINNFFTFAIDPIMKSIENGFSIGFIGEKSFIKGERIRFNRFTIQHRDITDIASSLDKLKGIGYSHNDINKFLGLPLVDEDWANEHYVTKNYGNVKGGEDE